MSRTLAMVLLCVAIPAAAQAPAAPWAVPLEGGPVETVLIPPEGAEDDVARLAARIELDSTVLAPAYYESRGAFEDALDDALDRDPAVVLTATTAFPAMSHDALARLFSAVDDGVGLVLADYGGLMPGVVHAFLAGLGPTDAPWLTHGLAHDLTPEWRSGMGFVEALSSGSGRVVRLRFGEPAPTRHFLLPPLRQPLDAYDVYLETYLSLVARATRWAAGRASPVAIQSIEPVRLPAPDPEDIPPDLSEEAVEAMSRTATTGVFRECLVTLNAAAPEDYAVEMRLRQPARRLPIKISYETPLRAGAATYRLRVAAGPGVYFLDVWLRDGRGDVVAWHSEPIRFEGATRDGWPALLDVQLSRRTVYPHDQVVVFARLEEPIPGGQDASVYVRAVDPRGRVVAATRVMAAGGTAVQAPLALADLMSPLVRVEVYALPAAVPAVSEGLLQLAAYRHRYLDVAGRDAGAFRVEGRLDPPALFPTPPHDVAPWAEYGSRARMRRLAGLGLDAVYVPSHPAAGFYAALAGLEARHEAARWRPDAVLDDVVRVPSLANPAYRDAEAAAVAERVRAVWGAGGPAVSLGAGNALTLGDENVCQSAASLRGYRAWLQQHYASLKSLNEAWGTNFGSWEAVTPAPEAAARTLQSYAPWVSFRCYMDAQFVTMHALGAQAVQDARPGARSGVALESPISGPYRGYDLAALAPALALIAVPPDAVALHALRSFRPTDGRTHVRAWADGDAERPVGAAWTALARGASGLWLDAGPLLQPEDRERPGNAPRGVGLTALAGLETVRDWAHLLRQATRPASRAAIVYDAASLYAARVLPEEAAEGADVTRGFVALFEGLGLPFRFIDAAQLAQTGPEDGEWLVLPGVHALDDSALAAVEAYADAGGSVVAAGRPGRLTALGATRDAPGLPDLPPPEALDWPRAEARPVYAAPGLISRLDTLDRKDRKRLVDGFLDAFDARESDTALSVRGASLFPGVATEYRYGAARVFLLVRDGADRGGRRVTLEVERAESLYEALAGDRAFGDTVRMSMPRGAAAIVTALPYRVTEFSLIAPESVAKGRRLPLRCSLEARGALIGPHLVAVRVTGPDLEPLPHYTRYIACADGAGEGYIPLALNEKPGSYRIDARDLLTGLTDTATVQVLATGPSD